MSQNFKNFSSFFENETKFCSLYNKGLSSDARDQPLPTGLLLDFSYEYRYCSIVTKDMLTIVHKCDCYQPYCLVQIIFCYTGPTHHYLLKLLIIQAYNY